jgi:hypothetical protein
MSSAVVLLQRNMIEVEFLVKADHTAISAANAEKIDIEAREEQDAVTGRPDENNQSPAWRFVVHAPGQELTLVYLHH